MNPASISTVRPAGESVLLPLTKLRCSSRNVRKGNPDSASVSALAESIRRVGLLQNLAVVQVNGHYEVVAGQRRLAALQLLAKNKHLTKEHPVACLLVEDDAAETISLTENVQREQMHPAEQYQAFAALVAAGRSTEDVAADFGVTPLVVQRRLKLANVSPRLLADYRAGKATLEQLMALSITDDHAAQETAFYDVPEWQRRPQVLREHLMEQEVDARTDPVARFVGLDEYMAAGGVIRRDLFCDDAQGGYLSDGALLERLALDKLAAEAAVVRAEGWSWIEVLPRVPPSHLYTFERARQERTEPTPGQAERLEQIQQRLQAIDDMLEAEEADDAMEALYEESRRLETQYAETDQSLFVYGPDVLAVGGAVVGIERDGTVVVHRGLVRKEDAKALRERQKARASSGEESDGNGGGSETDKPAKSAVSESLARRLSSHRTAALQIEVARRPDIALVAAVHALALNAVCRSGYHRSPVNVSARRQDCFGSDAPGVAESRAALALQQMRQEWAERLPEDADELFAALLDFEQADLLALLAVCVGSAVGAVTPRDEAPAAALAQAVELDMRRWWAPSAEGYFAHTPKAATLDAVREYAPDALPRLGKLKKQELAAEAERLCAGTGWLPKMLRAAATENSSD